MFLYSVIVVAVVALASAVFMHLFKLHKLLSMSVLLAIAASTMVTGILFPLIWGSVMNWSAGTAAPVPVSILGTFTIALLIFLALLLVLTVLISSLVTEKNMTRLSGKFAFAAIGRTAARLQVLRTWVYPIHRHSRKSEPAEEKSETFPETASAVEDAIPSEDTAEGKNILEKSVDTNENLDTMGVECCSNIGQIGEETEQNGKNEPDKPMPFAENGIHAVDDDEMALPYEDITPYISPLSEILPEPSELVAVTEDVDTHTDEASGASVESQIERAFSLKEAGDLEGALLCYMQALDKLPDDELVFWIILDTCVIYKTLGQVELARDILHSYWERYGSSMGSAIRMEIERNL